MKQEISAGVIVYRRDAALNKNVYLVLHYLSGHWDFPKGKLEAGETKIQAALREVKEETGLEVVLREGFEQALSYYFKDRSGQLVDKEVTFFIGKTERSEVTLSREHVYYKWLPFEDALKQLTFPNAQQLLRLAQQKINESPQVELAG